MCYIRKIRVCITINNWGISTFNSRNSFPFEIKMSHSVDIRSRATTRSFRLWVQNDSTIELQVKLFQDENPSFYIRYTEWNVDYTVKAVITRKGLEYIIRFFLGSCPRRMFENVEIEKGVVRVHSRPSRVGPLIALPEGACRVLKMHCENIFEELDVLYPYVQNSGRGNREVIASKDEALRLVITIHARDILENSRSIDYRCDRSAIVRARKALESVTLDSLEGFLRHSDCYTSAPSYVIHKIIGEITDRELIREVYGYDEVCKETQQPKLRLPLTNWMLHNASLYHTDHDPKRCCNYEIQPSTEC